MLSFFRPRPVGPVFVCPMDEAGMLSKKLKAALLVSISDPERRDVTRDRIGNIAAKICPLDFHDIERDAPGLVAPNEAHIAAALSDLSNVARHKPVLVHCHAGISRSSAVAIIIAVARNLHSGASVDQAVSTGIAQVRAATPHARPNMHIIELGARALKIDKTDFVDHAWELHRSGV